MTENAIHAEEIGHKDKSYNAKGWARRLGCIGSELGLDRHVRVIFSSIMSNQTIRR